jgi:4-amino-4-deoxychorismate lyase
MCLFFESIKVVNGLFCFPQYHQERINRTFSHFFPETIPIDIQSLKPSSPHDNKPYKARLIYRETLQQLEIAPYFPKRIKKVKLVRADSLIYPYKTFDRSNINALCRQFPGYDEWIFVSNGFLTDASISNIALYDGSIWVTPESPLLKGTCRARLLDQNLLMKKKIKATDLPDFQRISFINALLDLDEINFPVNKIQSMD